MINCNNKNTKFKKGHFSAGFNKMFNTHAMLNMLNNVFMSTQYISREEQ